ncbi:hypothetical protein MNB_SV-13-1463 [hydrothermal vent metagenome]|uniref:Uncharacterized protein n=1 Tax=hydrothermal vent metagenome TaxID=652676 RepID=A0A1W1CZV7_9ZZZZ
MSQAPQNLPKRVRVLVKDILFQERYALTHTQVDIMAYIINALSWAIKIGDFFPLTTKKFQEDLPQISEKTLEESLRVLKAMELIEVEMIKVPEWKNARVRGISVLSKGLEYNAGYYKADEQKIIESLKEQLRVANKKIENLEMIEEENKILEELKEEDTKDNNKYDDLEFTELVKTVTKEFGETSEPICNCVKGWVKETKFYINSYNKLTLLSPSGNVVQIKNPIEINNFWKYIDKNRHQIGNIFDFEKKLSIEELNKRYIGLDIHLNNINFNVYKIKESKNGVTISLKEIKSGKITTITRNGESVIFELKECEEFLLGLRSSY